MNKQVCIRMCQSYALESCTYCRELPTQQGSLQLFEHIGEKSSLERGGGEKGGGGAQGYKAKVVILGKGV